MKAYVHRKPHFERCVIFGWLPEFIFSTIRRVFPDHHTNMHVSALLVYKFCLYCGLLVFLVFHVYGPELPSACMCNFRESMRRDWQLKVHAWWVGDQKVNRLNINTRASFVGLKWESLSVHTDSLFALKHRSRERTLWVLNLFPPDYSCLCSAFHLLKADSFNQGGCSKD